jgi:predicted glutamine amidotransferase
MHQVIELLQILENHRYEELGEEHPVGGHGAGVSFLDASGKMVLYKVGKTNASPARELLRVKDVFEAHSRIVIGHVRYASPDLKDTIKHAEAAQPYMVRCLDTAEIVSVHNGKVRNYESIRKDLSKEHLFQSEIVKLVDSEVIPHFFEENLRKWNEEIEARTKTLEAFEGDNTIVLLTREKRKRRMHLHILHKGKTRGMHVWRNDNGEIVLCSREEPLQQVFGNFLKRGDFDKVLSIGWQEDKQIQLTYDIVGPQMHPMTHFLSEFNESDREEIGQISKTKSIHEIKQTIIDSLRDIEYDIVREDFEEVQSKLLIARKYLHAWGIRKLVDLLAC